MGVHVIDLLGLFGLTSHRSSKVNSSRLVSLSLNTQHNCGSQFVLSTVSLINNLNNVDRVPCSLHRLSLLGGVLGLLDENNSGEAIIQIPGVDRGDTTFIVQVTVDVKHLVGLDLKLPQTVRGDSTITKRGVVLVGPRRTVRVTITVVITQQVITVGSLVSGNLERLINSREEMFAKIRDQINQIGQVVLNIGRRHTPHQIKSTIKLISHCFLLYVMELCGWWTNFLSG
mmetsp:Transcript_31328/g.48900  ORF Transcript_31328/g.48900 Transcript_31328/m.48900 type:complete len:229 (-) Transcript_31328:11-697(-)